MKKLTTVNFEHWFVMKMKPWEVAAACNAAYMYEIEKETEKAICFRIFNPDVKLKKGFTMWAPKSAIISM